MMILHSARRSEPFEPRIGVTYFLPPLSLRLSAIPLVCHVSNLILFSFPPALYHCESYHRSIANVLASLCSQLCFAILPKRTPNPDAPYDVYLNDSRFRFRRSSRLAKRLRSSLWVCGELSRAIQVWNDGLSVIYFLI